jgi:hypothetical protein
MSRPIIAVIGNPGRSAEPALAQKAAFELGAELARRGCRVRVYSNKQDFAEWHAVQGYLSVSSSKEPASVEVRYPLDLDGRFPGEGEDDPRFLRIQQSGDWELSFYPSFADLDGIVLVAGGYTTKIAGLLAIGSQTPVVTTAGLGGAAREIWEQLGANRNSLATQSDLSVMAAQGWTSNSAARLLDVLAAQMQRKEERQRASLAARSDRDRRRLLQRLALVTCALLAVVLLLLVEAITGGGLWDPFLAILFFAPALAGASGAAVRVLWDNWQQSSVPFELRPISMTIALGFWASGVAGILFVLPQLWLSEALPDRAHLGKLTGLAAAVGLLAGLALDKVFPKLLKYDVPVNTDALNGSASRKT